MTPERAAYYRLMLLAGERSEFDQELDLALETEDLITAPVLDLALCMSDLNQTISVLHNYALGTDVDQQQVHDMIMATFRSQYISKQRTAREICEALDIIQRCCDGSDPWIDLYTYLYEFELLNEGIISQEVFEQGFSSAFLHGIRIDPWTLQKDLNQAKKKGVSPP